MYRKLPLRTLVPSAHRTARMSRMFVKKLIQNMARLGRYEPLTVTPHPGKRGKYEILNGHARYAALHAIGAAYARCEVWRINDTEAKLFLAACNKLRGAEVPELRMNLLFALLQEHDEKYLSARIPETIAYLRELGNLPGKRMPHDATTSSPNHDGVIMDVYLTHDQHRLITRATSNLCKIHKLPSSAQALALMAEQCIRGFSTTKPIRRTPGPVKKRRQQSRERGRHAKREAELSGEKKS